MHTHRHLFSAELFSSRPEVPVPPGREFRIGDGPLVSCLKQASQVPRLSLRHTSEHFGNASLVPRCVDLHRTKIFLFFSFFLWRNNPKVSSSLTGAMSSSEPVVKPQLPYWQINVPPERRTDDCPPFLRNISDKDKSILATWDRDYERTSWEEVKTFIGLSH